MGRLTSATSYAGLVHANTSPYHGVFEDFASASLENSEAQVSKWVSDQWVESSLQRLEVVRSGPVASPASSLGFNPSHMLVPLLNLARHQGPQKVSVVDVGGNCGTLGLWIVRQLGLNNLHWTVIEREDFLNHPSVAEKLPQEITFLSRIEELNEPVDSLHFGSTLQYIENLDPNYSRVIRETRPKWISVADFLGDWEMEDFVTWQSYWGGGFPVKFRNVPNFIKFVTGFGYELFLQIGSINEKNLNYWPSRHEPADRQVPLPFDLLFRRLEQ